MLSNGKCAAEARAEAEKSEAIAGVSIDKDTIHERAGGGSLNRSRAGGDIKRQRRVVLQNAG